MKYLQAFPEYVDIVALHEGVLIVEPQDADVFCTALFEAEQTAQAVLRLRQAYAHFEDHVDFRSESAIQFRMLRETLRHSEATLALHVATARHEVDTAIMQLIVSPVLVEA